MAPTYGEIERFCRHDGWTALPPGKHVPYEKIIKCEGLPPTVLSTHVSHDRSQAPSEGRFRAILAHQLRVTPHQFDEVLRTAAPARRPCPPPLAAPAGLPASLVHQVKRELHLTDADLVDMDKAEAVRRLQDSRARR